MDANSTLRLVTAASTALPPSRPASPQSDSFPPPPAGQATEQEQEDELTPLQLRLSLGRRILMALDSSTRSTTIFWSTVVTVIQLVAWVIVLALTEGSTCDKPLRLYLILTCIRLGLSLPFSLYAAVTPPSPRRRDSPERIAANELSRHVGSPALDRRVDRVSDLVSIFTFIIFILGNIWVASSDTCRSTAPTVFNSALAALVLSWFWSAQNLLIVIAVIFFLPFLLIAMRFFGVGQKTHEVGPLTEAEIAKIPLRIYIGSIPEPTSSTTPTAETDTAAEINDASSPKPNDKTGASSSVSPASAPSTTATSPTPHKRQFWRLWRSPARRRRGLPSGTDSDGASSNGAFVPLPKGMEGVLLPETQDACSICLMEYELPPLVDAADATTWEPEPLKLLPCKHAFHAPCLDSWLAVSGRCPLCQAPVVAVKGKKKRGGGGAGGAHGSADAGDIV